MQLNELFTEMAEALRTKEETTDKISAESFPQRIKDLKVLDTMDATATANDIVAGKIAYANGKRVIGTVIDNGKLEYTPSDEEQIIPAGKISGGVVKAIDSEEVVITPSTEEQVKEGLFNKVKVEAIKTKDLVVTPTTEEQKFTGLFKNVTVEAADGGIDTSDATATAEDILKDKTAYVNGEKVVGTLEVSSGGDPELETSFRSLIDNTFGANLTKLPEGLTSIGNYAFYAKQNLAITEIPEGVVELGESAFPSCHSLITLELPTTLEKIGMSCFSSCQNLKEVVFKGNIKQLGNNSIYNCGKLEKVVFSGVTAIPTLGNNAFTNSTTNLKIYVPDNLLSSFKTATNWKSHASRLYPISEL